MKPGKRILLALGLIGLCYFYAGSAYMSQFYRLMAFFDPRKVDLITSGLNYLLHAAGLGLSAHILRRYPELFRNQAALPALLVLGLVWMAIMQLSSSALAVVLAGAGFHLYTGVYMGWYLAALSAYVPKSRAGLVYGTAYAFGSVGTYVLSLIGEGAFLESKGVAALYLLLALGSALCAWFLTGKGDAAPASTGSLRLLRRGMIAVALMTAISVTGSGLFYSLPQAEQVNWNFIRAFYAVGLIAAGLLFDAKRRVGEICAAASLTYPLIAAALFRQGLTGTATLAASYAVRGFLTLYTVLTFTDPGAEDPGKIWLAPMGLLVSRAVEALLTVLLLYLPLPGTWQMILSAVAFVPLLVLLFMRERTEALPERSPEQRNAAFAERYRLTAREMEILCRMAEGLSDQEIADACFISRNTVRFHVSNILKKTETDSRVAAVRALQKY